jgi:hypothetical protein
MPHLPDEEAVIYALDKMRLCQIMIEQCNYALKDWRGI